MYIYISTYIQNEYIYIFVDIYIYIYDIYVYIHMCIYIICIYKYIYIHVCIHIYDIYIYVYTHIYIYIFRSTINQSIFSTWNSIVVVFYSYHISIFPFTYTPVKLGAGSPRFAGVPRLRAIPLYGASTKRAEAKANKMVNPPGGSPMKNVTQMLMKLKFSWIFSMWFI